MKKIIVAMFLTMRIFGLLGQDFAPIGAQWYYNERFAFSADINYIKFTSEKDTLIFGENCKKITKRHKIYCNNRPDVEYLFYRNDTVFFLDTTFNTFQILYAFNAQVNDSWKINIKDELDDVDTLTVTVNSISTSQINGNNLKTFHVTYYKNDENNPYTDNSVIIERIGDVRYMFNWYPWSERICDDNYSYGLQCYEDNDIGLYSTGIANTCNYEYFTGIEPVNSLAQISFFPNPAHDFVKFDINENNHYTLKIFDISGKLLLSKYMDVLNNKLDLSDLNRGIYTVVLQNSTQNLVAKKLVKL